MADFVGSRTFGLMSRECILFICARESFPAMRVSLPPGAQAHLVHDGDPRRLGELPLQQGVWVDGIWLHIGVVTREQVGQADARGTIAWGERAGSEGSAFEHKRPPPLRALVSICLVH